MAKKKVENEKEVIKDAEVIEKKSKKKVKVVPAGFIERLGAFIIDFFLISMIVSLITYPIGTSSNYEKLSKEANEVIEKYSEGKMDMKTYMSKTTDISYDMSRETGLISIINVFVFALYFIVFQFKNGGQTVGKKLLKIKVVKENSKELTINDVMFRSLIIDFILADIILLCVTLFGNKDIYYVGTFTVEFIQYGIVFISVIMMLSRKDKKGLHDLIVKTQVVKENNTVEELEVCEN